MYCLLRGDAGPAPSPARRSRHHHRPGLPAAAAGTHELSARPPAAAILAPSPFPPRSGGFGVSSDTAPSLGPRRRGAARLSPPARDGEAAAPRPPPPSAPPLSALPAPPPAALLRPPRPPAAAAAAARAGARARRGPGRVLAAIAVPPPARRRAPEHAGPAHASRPSQGKPAALPCQPPAPGAVIVLRAHTPLWTGLCPPAARPPSPPREAAGRPRLLRLVASSRTPPPAVPRSLVPPRTNPLPSLLPPRTPPVPGTCLLPGLPTLGLGGRGKARGAGSAWHGVKVFATPTTCQLPSHPTNHSPSPALLSISASWSALPF